MLRQSMLSVLALGALVSLAGCGGDRLTGPPLGDDGGGGGQRTDQPIA